MEQEQKMTEKVELPLLGRPGWILVDGVPVLTGRRSNGVSFGNGGQR